ncbi:hypothetical protein [Mucilaginibacter sp. HD30]
MKQKSLSVLSFLALCLLATACKKDPPIYPDDPDFVAYQSKGGGGGTSSVTVDLTLLTGKWQVSTTYTEVYSTNNVVQSSLLSPLNLYSGVQLSNTSKNYLFTGSSVAPDPGVFTTTTGSSVYIQLQQDPFGRSVNDKIQIINLTANSMTWLAIDPQILSTPGGSAKNGFKVVYTRMP